MLGSTAGVSAQTPGPTIVEVYASGLINPKGMAFGPDGSLYVAEAGKPGDVMVPLPVNFGGTGPLGTNARISRITTTGQRQDFVTGLPNVGLYGGIEMLGATGMALLDGTLYEVAAGHMTASPLLSRVSPDGRLARVADVGAFNRANPVGDDNGDAVPMGNPFDLVALGDSLYITDGNYNRVLRAKPDGSVTTLVTFPGDPTSVGAGAGPDGQLYVAQFGVAPYAPGSGRVDRVGVDGTLTQGVVTGLTTPIDVAFAPDGRMYVLQFAAQFNAERLRYVPAGGEVLRVNDDRTTTRVVSGLMFPSAMTFGPDGALYVSNYGNESNDGQGQILRVVPGNIEASGPRVPEPDESKTYALARPTPVLQPVAPAQIVATVNIVEPLDTMQWGFDPKTVTIQTGQAITVTNSGKINHTATQREGAFDTGFLKSGDSVTLTFDTPGTFAYFCQPHPWMQATIVVQGEARDSSGQTLAPLTSVPEEHDAAPTISPVQVAALLGLIGVLVCGIAFVGRRARSDGGHSN